MFGVKVNPKPGFLRQSQGSNAKWGQLGTRVLARTSPNIFGGVRFHEVLGFRV